MDPARDGWNLYSYARNNPIAYVDPDGELPLLATALGAGLLDAGFQVAINAIAGDALSKDVGKSFVSGAVVGATGVGALKVLEKGNKALQAARRAQLFAEVRRVGKAGEDAVQAVHSIGPKKRLEVPGAKRFRIPDGVTDETITEIKNRKKQTYTSQLRDMVSIAKSSGREFVLYIRSDTALSGPLNKAVSDGAVVVKRIPGS